MASITYQVVVDDLSNPELNDHPNKFGKWVTDAYRKQDSPQGHVAFVEEVDREEDEED